jgi:hypothetical protein
MNTIAIQAAVDRLHANAVPTGKIKIEGITYTLHSMATTTMRDSQTGMFSSPSTRE